MFLIRRAEEKIAELYPEWEMRCPTHLCIGQEAIAAGICQQLTKKDNILSGHRAHGHYLAKGGDLNGMIAEIYGKVTGCARGKGGSMHLIDPEVNFLGSTPIVGNSLPVAMGIAWASQMKSENTVTVSFFGDGAAEEGVLHECLNFSALKKIPLLFVCENNLYSVYTQLKDRQPKREIYKIAEAHGVKSFKADGNNIIEVYETTQKALEHIRAGKGPAFIEFSTYRWLEHCGPFYDDDLNYRPKNELKEWQDKDPLKQFDEKLLTDEMKNEIEKIKDKINHEVNEAFKFAKESKFPEPKELFEGVYAE